MRFSKEVVKAPLNTFSREFFKSLKKFMTPKEIVELEKLLHNMDSSYEDFNKEFQNIEVQSLENLNIEEILLLL